MHKVYSLLQKRVVTAGLILGITITALMADETRVDYSFAKEKIKKSSEPVSNVRIYSKVSHQSLSYVELPATELYAKEVGYPLLPMKTAKVLLPYNHIVTDIKVIPGNVRTLEGSYNIGYRKHEQISTAKDIPETEPDRKTYELKGEFPGTIHEKIDVQYKDNAAILLLRLFPVQYLPYEGKVRVYENLRVIITTRPDQSSILNKTTNITSIQTVMQAVDNPQSIATYPNVKLNESGYLENFVSPLAAYKYVIITDETFSSGFQALINHKKARGISARIRTTSYIYSNFDGTRPDGGSDNQTKIRNFIKWAKENWNTEYILLGGDDEIIPHRGCRGYVNSSYQDNDIPADIYYACLDGTWDNDADGIYGESNDGNSGGEVDLLSDIFVGRAPVDSVSEVVNFVNKTINFEKNVNEMRGLMTGTQLNATTWGGDHKDVVADIFPATWSIDSLYERNSTATTTSVVNAINSGNYIILNSAGHGNTNSFSCLSRSNVDALTNTIHPFVYTWACYTASFDNRKSNGAYETNDCIAEHFVQNSTGAFAYVGNSRYGWYSSGSTNGSSQKFEKTFFQTLFNDNITNLGKTLADSKEDLVGSVGSTGSMRWVYFCLNLLGDPETSLDPEPVCYPGIANPALSFTGTESYTAGGVEYIRYKLSVSNWNIYPNDMFSPAPYLPPCGSNPNSSRTWVDIYKNDGAKLYGFCALGSPSSLTNLWFSICKGNKPPQSAYILMDDRACDLTYQSSNVTLQNAAALPSFTSTFKSTYTRGFWFQAPADFVITGLKVPAESGHAKQNVEVVKFNPGVTPPAYSSTTNSFTSLYRRTGSSSSDTLNVYIPVYSGDVIGILGAAGDTALMHNSYGAGDFNSTIFGNSVTFKRLGMQYNLANYSCRNLWTLSGSIGRIQFWYTK